jgi:ribosomal-protein-alanine N-acetyltransferase
VLYRLYNSQDLDELYAIEEVCFELPDRFGRRYMGQLVGSSNGATWIAEQNRRMAGFAIVEWAQDADETIAYIETIEVLPADRGQGVGSRLLDRIEASACSANAAWIWLHVDAANEGAIRLYEAHGYSCEGRHEDYYGPSRAALIYTKPLVSETTA